MLLDEMRWTSLRVGGQRREVDVGEVMRLTAREAAVEYHSFGTGLSERGRLFCNHAFEG